MGEKLPLNPNQDGDDPSLSPGSNDRSILGTDSSGATRRILTDFIGNLSTASSKYAIKITESGDTTYIALAIPGASQASAVWQVMRIDESDGMVLTWADGNSGFDNVATDLTALSYS